jgi:hypothetical protein
MIANWQLLGVGYAKMNSGVLYGRHLNHAFGQIDGDHGCTASNSLECSVSWTGCHVEHLAMWSYSSCI